MLSIIIPSLMRIERLKETILELSKCDVVGEIILIDNSKNNQPWDIPKLKHICEETNIYINPAWNKGASLAKYDKLCFMNDDIWFDWSYLKEISEYISPDVGFIGMAPENYETPSANFQIIPIEPNTKALRGHRPIGFACCFFVHKSNWDPIPDDIKLWAGDDWLFYRSRGKNHLICGIKCFGFLSATLSDSTLESELGPIKTNDMLTIKEYVKQGLVPNFLIGTIWWN